MTNIYVRNASGHYYAVSGKSVSSTDTVVTEAEYNAEIAKIEADFNAKKANAVAAKQAVIAGKYATLAAAGLSADVAEIIIGEPNPTPQEDQVKEQE